MRVINEDENRGVDRQKREQCMNKIRQRKLQITRNWEIVENRGVNTCMERILEEIQREIVLLCLFLHTSLVV